MSKIKVAIIGSGNIGTDLLLKLLRRQGILEVAAFVGIDAQSEGLGLAAARGVPTTAGGIEAMISMPDFKQIQIVFDATSARAHRRHHELLRPHGKRIIDLTPAAIGPYSIPPVNGEEHLEAPNVNMVTCGGQATIPIVAAISRITPVRYGEIVASIASRSAGPGTRANIDEFTETTSRAIESLGGAQRGKAIIVLNPAEPPLVMRDTVYCLTDHADEQEIAASIGAMVKQVQSYVPGYRLKQAVQFERVTGDSSVWIPEMRDRFEGLKITTFLEVEGAADYLPAYAGNLDIMTSAAVRTGERIAVHLRTRSAA